MEDKNQGLEDIREIRKIMERSSRFISLSGLSGILAGIVALISAAIAFQHMQSNSEALDSAYIYSIMESQQNDIWFFILLGIATVIVALSGAYFLTRWSANRRGLPLWDKQAKNLLLNLMLPLAGGGIFCLILIHHGLISLAAPATLVFYGLALIHAGKYTLEDIRVLGIMELITGLFASWFIGYSLLFWAFGFGILHIIYGARMYFKYEKGRVV